MSEHLRAQWRTVVAERVKFEDITISERTEPDGYIWFKTDPGHATLNGRVQGTTFFVRMLEVGEFYQRQGLATALMDHLVQWCAERGLTINHGGRTDPGRRWWEQYAPSRGLAARALVCDECGDPVTTIQGALSLAWIHRFPRPSRGYHAVTVNGEYDPPQDQR